MATTSLAEQRGIKAEHHAAVCDLPAALRVALLPPFDDAVPHARPTRHASGVVLLVRARRERAREAPRAIAVMRASGPLWVWYPHQRAGAGSDLSREGCWKVRAPFGWRRVARSAADEAWSALHFRTERSAGPARERPPRLRAEA